MKLEKIIISNFKAIESLEISLPRFYSAICGRNNAGKSTVFSAIQELLCTSEEYITIFDDEQQDISKDFPIWKKDKEADETSIIELSIRIYRKADAGIFRFIETFTKEKKNAESILVSLKREKECKKNNEKLSVTIDGSPVSDEFKAREIHKKFRSSRAFISHNSTAHEPPYYYMRKSMFNLLGEISEEDRKRVKTAGTQLKRVYSSIAKKQKKEIEETLGKLEEKYQVGISIPSFEIDRFAFGLTLADKKVALPLEDWGSGTQNKTRIFLALLRAKRITEATSDSDKITPFILIEEPECFLHPSAQAEFGAALRDLSEEFGVQVICTSHSPYLLSMEHPESNILLQRKISRGQELGTEVIDTKGESWMNPFALSLGIDNDAFKEWKSLLFKKSDNILLVEGEIDKEYFEMLRKDEHGKNKLLFDGEIFAYGGVGFFSNTILLKFVMNIFKKVFITFDLDAAESTTKKLEGIGLRKKENFIGIGKPDGQKCIEGLLPERIDSIVFSEHPNLVNASMSGDKNSKNEIKRLKLETFKKTALIDNGDFKEFYSIVTIVNKAMKN